MAIPSQCINPDGSLRPLTPAELAVVNLRTADVGQGDHPTWRLDPLGCQVSRQWFFRGAHPNYTQQALQDLAVYALLGAAKTYRDQTGRLQLSRVMPSVVPGYPQYAALAIETLKGALSAGRDDPTGVPQYKDRKAEVRHEQVFFRLAGDGDRPLSGTTGVEQVRYVEVLPSKTEVTYLTLQGNTINYVRPDGTGVFGFTFPPPHGVPIPFTIGRPEVQTSFSLKWWRLPRDVWGPGSELWQKVKGSPATPTAAALTPLIGTVNKSGFQGRDAGTVLLVGVDEEIVPDPVADDLCVNLTLNFLEKTQGHNNLWWGGSYDDTSNNGYYLAVKGTTYYAPGSLPDGKALFNERNLNTLFDVGLPVT